MIIGYAKITAPCSEIGIEAIRQDLMEAGAQMVFIDADDSWINGRPAQGIDTAMAACGAGDVLMTPSPAHLARTLAGLVHIANRLTEIGASLRVLKVAGGQTLDTATPSGAMMLGALGLMASFEMPAAPAAGAMTAMFDAPMQRRPRGRPPTASTKADEIANLRAAGLSAVEIANRLKICRASVYRVMNLGAQPATMPMPVASTGAAHGRVAQHA